MPAAADDRDRVRSLLVDLHDLEAVTEAPPHGQSEAVDEHDARGGRPGQGPDEARQRVAHERRPEGDLVGEGESQGQVHEQVDRPPPLPAHAAADRVDRRARDRDHQRQSDGRCDHVGVGVEERGELVPDAGPGRLGVGKCQQHGMGNDERDRPRRQAAVQGEQPVLSEHAFDHGDPADEQHHDKCQVAPGETCQVAEEHGDAPGRPELAPGLGRHREGDAGPEAEPDHDGRHLGERWARSRPGSGDGGAATRGVVFRRSASGRR